MPEHLLPISANAYYVPDAVIPANAGIQWRLIQGTGFRVSLRGPGMTACGRQDPVTTGSYLAPEFNGCFAAGNFKDATSGSCPLKTVEESGMQTFAKTARKWKAAVRYALVLFLPELRLCNGNCHPIGCQDLPSFGNKWN